MPPVYLQRTIARPAVVCGFGYWSGEDVSVELRPAAAGSGITFVRRDLQPAVAILAHPALRLDAPRRTNLCGNGVQVDMVEHVLAALSGMQIDNCEVWVDAQEMPGCDGSAAPFVSAIEQAGIVEQSVAARYLMVTHPIRVGDADSWVEARPPRRHSLRIEFVLDYPKCPAVGRQTCRVELSPETFATELATCRTFVLQSEAEQLQRSGRASRVTPQDLLVFGEQGPIDNELRFANECARHKALDVLGDLALAGRRILGEIRAYRSGHRLNACLAARLMQEAGFDASHVAA